MLTCLVLGMGIPTIPNYIITSSLAGPALLELGVPLLVSHMFVFYFGIMADLTPPVALAAFAAAPMAEGVRTEDRHRRRPKLAIAGFVVPFMAVYTPALMLQDRGPIAAGLRLSGRGRLHRRKACLGIVLWGAAVVGFLVGRLAFWERLARLRRRRAPGARAAAHRRDRLGAGRDAGSASTGGGARRRRRAAMSLCIPAAGKVTVLAVSAFTLSWSHSVEKTRWEEDWRVDARRAGDRRGAREGSGAGMEPPQGALCSRMVGGFTGRQIGARPMVALAASGATGAGWTLCSDQACMELGAEAGAAVELSAVPGSSQPLITHDKAHDRQRNFDTKAEAAVLVDPLDAVALRPQCARHRKSQITPTLDRPRHALPVRSQP